MNRKVGVILSYILMVFEVVSTLLLTPFILRCLGQAEYGVFKLSSVITTYFLLLDLGVGNAVIRYISKYRAEGDLQKQCRFLGVATLFYAAIAVITLLVGVALVLAYPTIFARGLTARESALGQQLLLVTIINAAVTLAATPYTNLLIAYERFSFSKGCSIIQIILRILMSLLALRLGMRSSAIVLINLLTTVLCKAAFVLYVTRCLKLRPAFCRGNGAFIKEVTVYSAFIFLQMLATQMNSFADQVLIGMLVPAATVLIAVYGIGAQLSQYFQSIGAAFSGVMMPGLVRLVEQKATPTQLCNEMIRIGRVIFAVLALVFVCFAFFGRQFISLWVGDENLQAYYIALLLMFAYTFILTQSVGGQLLWAMNQHREQSIAKLAIVVLNIGLTVLLIQWHPLYGAVLGTFISLMCGDVMVMNLIFRKKIGIRLRSYYTGLFRGIVPSLAIAAGAAVLLRLLHLSGWHGFAVNVAVVVAVYAAMLWQFGFQPQEKEMLKGVYQRLIHRGGKK